MEDDDQLRSAARQAVDQQRLLPGEERDLRSTNPRDAAHWAAVYCELLDFKRQLLRDLAERLETVSDDARPEIDNDLVILVAEESRLAQRHDFWVARVKGPVGDNGDELGIT